MEVARRVGREVPNQVLVILRSDRHVQRDASLRRRPVNTRVCKQNCQSQVSRELGAERSCGRSLSPRRSSIVPNTIGRIATACPPARSGPWAGHLTTHNERDGKTIAVMGGAPRPLDLHSGCHTPATVGAFKRSRRGPAETGLLCCCWERPIFVNKSYTGKFTTNGAQTRFLPFIYSRINFVYYSQYLFIVFCFFDFY